MLGMAMTGPFGYHGGHECGLHHVYRGLETMTLPNGTEVAWFLCGMWASLFILRAGRASQSGFFAVMATLVLAVLPAIALLFQEQLGQLATAVAQAIHSR